MRLRCPAQSAEACAGELSLRRAKKRATELGSKRFELAPAAKRKVRVRIVRHGRQKLLRQASRRHGVNVRATAATAFGRTVKKITLESAMTGEGNAQDPGR